MIADEQNILTLIRKNDLHGYIQLFDSYYAMLCGIANGYLRNRQQAEEIVDDVFLRYGKTGHRWKSILR